MKKVIITGANGQLGKCIQLAAKSFPSLTFFFLDKSELDISNKEQIKHVFESAKPTYCINCAAYTQVEMAEQEQDQAFLNNAEGVRLLSEACKSYNVTLLHISTDYVFNGHKRKPYTENDQTDPINVYGKSKAKGEQYIQEVLKAYYIIRTSWLYSQFGTNFYTSVKRWAREKESLSITTEQTGSPTNANDLAVVLLTIIESNFDAFGVYHFCNSGKATWYDFAKAILEKTGQIKNTKLAKIDHYPTFAARPKYSILDNSKISKVYGIQPKDWVKALKQLN